MGTEQTADWVLFQLRSPGLDLLPAGVLLLDLETDKLLFELRELAPTEDDEDLIEIWEALGADLELKAEEMGGGNVLSWLESDASHIFQISERHQISFQDANAALKQLFELHVREALHEPGVRSGRSTFAFDALQLSNAASQLAPLPSAAIQIIALLNDPDSSLLQAERSIAQDPVLTAHLIRLANLANLSFREPARTLMAAIQRLGFEAVKLQTLALTSRQMFAAPSLRKIWNHSVNAAHSARHIAKLSDHSADEAALVALVHDIGQVVLHSLGQSYLSKYDRLRSDGLYPVQIEYELCGKDHSEIGAELLLSWSFPADMVEAVRHHHAPCRKKASLTSILYLAESSMESDEDVFKIADHGEALAWLGLQRRQDYYIAGAVNSDLLILRFAA